MITGDQWQIHKIRHTGKKATKNAIKLIDGIACLLQKRAVIEKAC